MSVTPEKSRFTAWPLWATLSSLLTFAALLCEKRIDATSSFDYPVEMEQVLQLDHLPFRISGALGYAGVLMMLVLAALWRQRVERRFSWSFGATLVTFSAVSAAALNAIAFGWRASLGNYLPGGAESETYGASGLYVYYMLTDFGPYIAQVPLLGAGFGLAWMAFREGLVSKPLGALAGIVATALLVVTFVTGVPGLPAMILPALAIGGIWLAFGRSAITQP